MSEQVNKYPWFWSRERVLEVLATRAAMAAMRGKPSPVTALVLARIESAS